MFQFFGGRKKGRAKEIFDVSELRKSNIPILTLDVVWHEMFPKEKKSNTINKMEQKVTELLKEQGKLNNEYKEYIKLKKKMMDKILALTTDAFDHENEQAKKEMEKNQQMILEINQRLEEIEEGIKTVPVEIQKANGALLEETVRVCYKEMKQRQRESNELQEEIQVLRDKLKEKLETKTYDDERAEKIYSYLHDIVGAGFIEKLDQTFWE